MDRIIRVLRVVAAPMVKKTVNLDFVQNMNFVSRIYSPESPIPMIVEVLWFIHVASHLNLVKKTLLYIFLFCVQPYIVKF